LTFDQNKWVSTSHGGPCILQVWLSVVEILCEKNHKQTDKHKRRSTSYHIHPTAASVTQYRGNNFVTFTWPWLTWLHVGFWAHVKYSRIVAQ